jgi:hypothetical protein
MPARRAADAILNCKLGLLVNHVLKSGGERLGALVSQVRPPAKD